MKKFVVLIIAMFIMLGISASAMAANLPSGTLLTIDKGFNGASSYFTMAASSAGLTTTAIRSTTAAGAQHPNSTDGGLILGIAQPNGSCGHAGPPNNATDFNSVDKPWSFFGNTGMHFDNLGINADPDTGIIDMTNSWFVAWGGICAIDMGGDLVNTADTGVGTFNVVGTNYTVDYNATVPLCDPSGFGGVPYGLHLEGRVISPADPCDGVTCDPTGNDCTENVCDPADGLCKEQNVADDTACDDGDLCTENDTCTGGSCIPGTDVVCSDDGNPCTTESCAPGTGQCITTDNSNTCDDGVDCTESDVCSGGICSGTPNDGNCDDGNLCTDDSCDPASGCANDPVVCPGGQSCDPGTGECVPDDLCSGVTCDDGNICTDDSCDPATGNCVFTDNTASCDDGDACTENDACSGGSCQPGGDVDCDDGDLCTDDSCDPSTGCANAAVACPAGQSCDPGTGDCVADDLCTGVTCDDGNICTDDSCDPATGNCVFTDNTASCDDGDACTENDACSGGSCQPGGDTNCDDANLCTDDSCDPASGCANDPVDCPGGQSCDPADGVCKEIDLCDGVICVDDGNPCTQADCDPATGECVTNNVPGTCDDGDSCTDTDVCADGVCSGTPIICGEGEVCEEGVCVPEPTESVDVKLQRFHVPMNIKECRKKGKDIAISVKNLGDVSVMGDVTLFKDGVPEMVWEDVEFDLIGGRRTNLIFTYLPDPEDTGETIEWQAVVDVTGDPNPSNNTSRVKKMRVKPCK